MSHEERSPKGEHRIAPVLTDRSPDNASILGTIELCRSVDFNGDREADYGPTVSARKVIELCESVLSLRAERDAALAEVAKLKAVVIDCVPFIGYQATVTDLKARAEEAVDYEAHCKARFASKEVKP